MDGQSLRDTQAPLKQRYRDEPAAATVTLVADGSLDGTDLTCSVRTGRADGDLDFRVTLGVDKQAPVGCSDIRLHFDPAGADLDDEQRGTLLRLTERYCVVLQTLRTAPSTTATIS